MAVAQLESPIGTHPLFLRCSRDEMRRIGRWGDEVALPAGQRLLAEDTIPHWFFVVLEGRLDLSRAGRFVATAGPGDRVGDEAILGFAPQPCTVVTASPCRLFVMGRRYLISLTYDLPGLQRGLWDDIDDVGLAPRLRELRAAGTQAWAEMTPAARVAAAEAPPAPPWLAGSPGPRRAVPGSFQALAAGALHHRPLRSSGRPQAGAIRWRALLGAVVAVLVASVCFALMWHPPVAVVVPGEPVDIGGDISVTGRPTHPVNGAYVMATVEFQRPTLAGLLVAQVRGERTIDVADIGSSPSVSRDIGRRAFSDARGRAVAAAARAVGIEPGDLDVRFRDRAVSGPSAALVYALALVDLLDGEDMSRGRTVVATGALTGDGRVLSIGYVAEKWRVARSSGADLFLVPPGQRPASAGDLLIEPVASLDDALDVLRRR